MSPFQIAVLLPSTSRGDSSRAFDLTHPERNRATDAFWHASDRACRLLAATPKSRLSRLALRATRPFPQPSAPSIPLHIRHGATGNSRRTSFRKAHAPHLGCGCVRWHPCDQGIRTRNSRCARTKRRQRHGQAPCTCLRIVERPPQTCCLVHMSDKIASFPRMRSRWHDPVPFVQDR